MKHIKELLAEFVDKTPEVKVAMLKARIDALAGDYKRNESSIVKAFDRIKDSEDEIFECNCENDKIKDKLITLREEYHDTISDSSNNT